MTPRRGAEGRALARAPGVAGSGARVEDALERLGHEVVAIDVGGDLVARLREARARRRVRRAARPRRRGRHRAGAARGARDPLHRLGRPRLHALLRQGAGQARAARRRPADARLGRRSARSRFHELGAGRGAGGDRGAARASRSSSSRSSQGSSLGVKFARSAAERAGRAGRGALLRTARCCSSATSRGASSRSRARRRRRRAGAWRCRSSRRCRASASSTTSRRATRSAAPTFVCPAELDAERRRARPGDRARGLGAARLPRLRARRHDPRRRRADRARGQPDPRPDRDEPAPAGRRRRRDELRRGRRARARRTRSSTVQRPAAGGSAQLPATSVRSRRRRSPRA